MTKVRTTLTIDPEVLRAVKVRAARLGKGDSDVIEEALRRDLEEADALALAVEAQHSTRD
jgi:predicted DNA-binding protein